MSGRGRGTAVYLCHCGQNIAATVDVSAVAESLREIPGVTIVRHYPYLCSRPGQELIRGDLKNGLADNVVVAACSPRMHEATFRKAIQAEGLNPYLLCHVNVREQCSWVHPDRGEATEKARELVLAGLMRARLQEPLSTGRAEVRNSALVVGAGVAGLSAAAQLAATGINVTVVEREKELGGHAAKVESSFAGGGPVQPLIERLTAEIGKSPNAELLLGSEVAELSGEPGNFRAMIHGPGGDMERSFGALIVATGFEVYDPSNRVNGRPELGYGDLEGVLTQGEFDRFLAGEGGLEGVESLVFVQCVGSRDKTTEGAHCSRACCMVSVRQAREAKKAGVTDVSVLYTDLRAYARGGEEEYEAAGRDGVIFRRGGVSEIFRRGGVNVVRFEDTLAQRGVEEEAMMVVLACGARPAHDSAEVSRRFGLGRGADGFFMEAHPKLRPSETQVECVYLAGACQGPKTIDEAALSGRAAAVKAAATLLKGWLPSNPVTASIDPELCSACGLCQANCPAGAITSRLPDSPRVVRSALCKGCGACAAACPSSAATLKHFTGPQILAEIEGLLTGHPHLS